MTTAKLFGAGLLMTVIAGGAVAQGTMKDHAGIAMDPSSMQTMMDDMAAKPSDAPSTKAFKAVDMRMMMNMHVAWTGDPDVDFRTHMIPHHQGAIDMAEVALKEAKDADTKAMATMIIDAQKKEIAKWRTG